MAAGPLRCASCGSSVREPRGRCRKCGATLEQPLDAARRPRRQQWWIVTGACALVALGLVARSVAVPRARPQTLPDDQVSRLAAPDPQAPAAVPIGGISDGGVESQADLMRSAAEAYARGDFGAALAGYQRAMREHPDDSRAANNVAQLLVRVGRPAEAIPLLEQAVAAEPSEWSYRFNLARARAQVRDWPGAVADYREADRLMPGDGPTLYNLGLALQRTGADAEAVQALEQARAEVPDDPTFVLALARSYQRLAKTDEARAAFERYLDMAPQSADAPAARQALASLVGPQAAPAQPAGAPIPPAR